jgi:DNA-binding MarR family transcriptional regulator
MAENLKQLLLSSSDWFAEELMKGVKDSDYAYITPAQSRLLAHMGGKPMSMAALARRLAISRQAVHKTVGELNRRGILEVRDDPTRNHGKLIAYTDKGRSLNRAGAHIIDGIEQTLARRLGSEKLKQLKSLLAEMPAA